MIYDKSQSFNDWNKMLSEIYDKTQNYSKSAYEIHCHLTEVAGGFGKYFIKKRKYEEAENFLTSIFAWALALIRKVTDNQKKPLDVDKIIFKKFPGVCPYCLTAPCSCGDPNNKNTENYKNLKSVIAKYIENNEDPAKRIKDIQKMIGSIYSETWNRYNDVKNKGTEIQLEDKKEIAYYNISFLYSRMMEELAEIAEAIRFYHLYKSNFENEIADFFAWYFAIVSIYHELYDEPEKHKIDLEKILWEAFPGVCYFCNMPKCVCRPGPVRELLSKPSIDEYENYDEVTQTENFHKLREHIEKIEGMGDINKKIFPISVLKIILTDYSTAKIDKKQLESFKREIASVLRKRIRYDRDKFYSNEFDELFILCHDTNLKEVEGLYERIEKLIADKNIENLYPTIKFQIKIETFTSIYELKSLL